MIRALLMSKPAMTAATAVTLTDVAQDQTVLQRVGTSKAVSVSGTSNGSHVTLEAVDAVTGVAVAASGRIRVIGGSFTGAVLVPQGAWYKLKVKDCVTPAVSATGTNKFGVGVVVGLIGQSNMAGFKTSEGAYPLGSPLAIEYEASSFRRLGNVNDAFPPNTLSPVYTSYTTPGTRGDGTVFFANNLASALGNVPVCVVNRAQNGTSIAQWQAGQTSFTSFTAAVAAVGDMEACLWLQGESNAAATSKASYKTSLGQLHANLLTATGRSASDFKFGVISLGPGSFSGSIEGDFGKIRAAHVEYTDEAVGAFYVTGAHDNFASDGVHIGYTGHGRLGKRYAASLAGALSGQNKSGPRITSATRSGSVITLGVEHRGGATLANGGGGTAGALTGFQVLDGAAAATITAAGIASANSITLTLSAVPSGVVTVSYGMQNFPHGTSSAVDLTTAVYDNQATPMLLQPLQSMAVTP